MAPAGRSVAHGIVEQKAEKEFWITEGSDALKRQQFSDVYFFFFYSKIVSYISSSFQPSTLGYTS